MRQKWILVTTGILAVLAIVVVIVVLGRDGLVETATKDQNRELAVSVHTQEQRQGIEHEDEAHRILRFVEEHPEKASLTIVRDGYKLAASGEHRMMPLASAVKTVIAVAYARQAASGKLNPDQAVKLSDLERFYLPGLDGGAHAAWLKKMQAGGFIQNGTVPLREVAKGMIMFSSNANAEFLMDTIGLGFINATRIELGLKQHEPIYPFVSSLLIPYECIQEGREQGMTQDQAVAYAKQKVQNMTDEQFRERAGEIHQKLARKGSYKTSANIVSWYDNKLDRMNSDRFIKSTTADYASLMGKLNSRTYFTPSEQKLLDEVMEKMMDDPSRRQWLSHAGRKGGSTTYILNEALYATDKEGHATEIALFMNPLDAVTQKSLLNALSEFELQVLQKESFRKEIQERIGQKE